MNVLNQTYISTLELELAVSDTAQLIQVTFHSPSNFEQLKAKTSEAFKMTVERLTIYFEQYAAFKAEKPKLEQELSVLKKQNPWLKLSDRHPALDEDRIKQKSDEVANEINQRNIRMSIIQTRLAQLENVEDEFFKSVTQEIMNCFNDKVKPEDQKAEWDQLNTLGTEYWEKYDMNATF